MLRNPNTPKSFDTTHMHPSSIQHDVFCLLRLKFSRLGKEKKGWSGGGMVLEKRGRGGEVGACAAVFASGVPRGLGFRFAGFSLKDLGTA